MTSVVSATFHEPIDLDPPLAQTTIDQAARYAASQAIDPGEARTFLQMLGIIDTPRAKTGRNAYGTADRRVTK